MTASESRRLDLYNGLNQVLGSELTDTLMAYLPTTETAALVTKDDMTVVKDDIRGIKDDIRGIKDDIRHLAQRVDRIQLTLLAGFISMVVALIVAVFFG